MATTGIIALGAITAALVAGFFSFLNLIISKEQKVSEFRQEWIDSLRADVAQYISAIRYVATANALWSFHSDAEENGQDVQKIHWHEHWVALKVPYDNAARAYSSIFLRINTNDIDETTKKLNLDFLHKLKEVRDAVRNDDYDAAAEAADELNELVKPILKLEWERVKAGEAGYR